MKSSVIFASLLASTPLFAGGPYFHPGVYKGQGWCKTEQGANTLIDSELRIDEWKIAHLATDRKTTSLLAELFIETRDRGHGIFDVLLDGSKVGWGYCTSLPCHISMTFKNESDELNINPQREGDTLVITWSTQSPKRTLVCEETLKKQTSAAKKVARPQNEEVQIRKRN